jgi:lipopolysaccharide transport system ATP-binding protein
MIYLVRPAHFGSEFQFSAFQLFSFFPTMPPVIQVENLSKLYRLGEVSTGTLSHDLNRWWHRVRGKEDPYLKIGQVNDRTKTKKKAENLKAETLKSDPDSGSDFSSDYVYALKDINFSVNQGEVLGIIGRNGAGKSTLLKILSRVTSPSSGRIKVKGRIASLLEVGTGFHPELTGRENIYLNGAILGMRSQEITRKLDEIVDFSGCAAYLDTPSKRYSSGMIVRLAFAVAAFLEAEILVIDEVLAVGDAEFQKKCLGKMEDVASAGRTLLFVSHNMGMISSLCQRAVVLEEGQLAADQTASEAVMTYYTKGKSSPYHVDFQNRQKTDSGLGATLLSGVIENSAGTPVPEIDIRSSFRVRMKYRLERSSEPAPFPNLHFTDSAGNYVFVTLPSSTDLGQEPGVYEAVCHVPANLLNNGAYFVGLALTYTDKGVNVAFWEKDALCINVVDPIHETLDQGRNGYSGHIPGPVRPRLDWTLSQLS